ncbi:MAG: YggU family protein [Chloroflexi bacterium]|nr:MAG: YggU family protein [Chloroflexota bacterium]
MKIGRLKITEVRSGVTFPVQVVPRASKNEIAGIHGDALKVRLTAPPVEGRANEALIAFLAQRLGVRKSQVEIVAGATSRRKMVRVTGLSPQEVEQHLLN